METSNGLPAELPTDEIDLQYVPPFEADDDGEPSAPRKRMDPTGFIVLALEFLDEDGAPDDSNWRELGRAICTLTGGWLPGFILFKNWSRSLGRSDDDITSAWTDFCPPGNAMADRAEAMDVFDRLGLMDFAYWPAVRQCLFVADLTGPAKGLEDLFNIEDAPPTDGDPSAALDVPGGPDEVPHNAN